jgi:hypothetical protein
MGEHLLDHQAQNEHGRSSSRSGTKLQDSKYIELAKLQVHFRPYRKYADLTDYIHVRVPFNFSNLLMTPDRINAHYDKYVRIWPEPFKTQMKQIIKVSRSCL